MHGNGFNLVLRGCKLNIADNPQELKKVMDKLVRLTKLKKLGTGDIQKGADKLPGYSLTQMIETSHIAIHGFSTHSKNDYIITIVSCAKFDARGCVKHIIEAFMPRYKSVTHFQVKM